MIGFPEMVSLAGAFKDALDGLAFHSSWLLSEVSVIQTNLPNQRHGTEWGSLLWTAGLPPSLAGASGSQGFIIERDPQDILLLCPGPKSGAE